MTYGQWLLSKEEWQTPRCYDLASIAILLRINVDSIITLQGTEARKVSELPRW